jgi:hypothetical protein|tara:strand:+ start:424 stop:1101 length:678 start_codon:yes stop_codon:yes gene_type:complete
MKKFLVLFIILFSSNVLAHMDHYKKYNKIEMDIYRNGKLIGHNFYFFTRKDDETVVTNQIMFSVKVLGAAIFKVEGYGEEKYFKDQLISYNSKTFQNDKEKFVNLVFDKSKNKFIIKGSSYTGEASINNIIGNWWSHKILQTSSQISPISGSIKEQVVTFVGKEKIEQYGQIYEVDHFKLNSKDMSLPKNKILNFDIWFDKKSSMIVRVSYSRMGNWEYRLKNLE